MKTTRSIARVVTALTVGLLAVFGLAGVAAASNGNGAGGVTGPAFYVDGELYRTVGTPTDLTNTGAPAHSFDVIYDLGDDVTNVAEAKPGDRDFNGGRWRVHQIVFDDFAAAVAASDMNGSGTFDSAEEVEYALEHGLATDKGVVRSFVCPVLEIPGT